MNGYPPMPPRPVGCWISQPCVECAQKHYRIGKWPDMYGVPVTFCEMERIASDGP